MMSGRDALRAQIKVELTTMVRGQPRLLCAWCSQPLIGGFDIHEAIIKRSKVVRGKQHLIFVLENCVPLHRECHDVSGQSAEMKRRCIEYLCSRLSARQVAVWHISLWREHGLSVPQATLPEHDSEKEWRRYLWSI